MLDVNRQATDFGKVRTNNEDAMDGSFPRRVSRRARTVFIAVADGVAAWTWAKLRRLLPSPC